MKTLVSMKVLAPISMVGSVLVHFFPAQLAADLQPATKLCHDFVATLQAVLGLRIVGQPPAELLVERGVLSTRPFAGSFDKALVGTESDTFHRIDGVCTGLAYTVIVC